MARLRRIRRLRGIEHYQHQIRIGQGFHGFLYADAFGFVEGAADSGGVHQLHRNSAERNGFGHEIARGAGRGGDDGALALDQAIEQARLADVGAADDGEGQALVDNFPVGERAGEFFERRADCADVFEDLFAGEHGDIVFGKINSGFEKRNQLHQLLFDRLQAAGERAFELLGGDLRLIERLRIDQVADGFGLGEVDASVEEGAHGELARLGKARAAGESEFDDVAEDDGRSVGGDFDDVVSGVGMRLGEIGDDDFVDALRFDWCGNGSCGADTLVRAAVDEIWTAATDLSPRGAGSSDSAAIGISAAGRTRVSDPHRSR